VIGPFQGYVLLTFIKDHAEWHESVRAEARTVFKGITAGLADSKAEVEQVRALAECRPTGEQSLPVPADGRLGLTARVAGNGLNVVIIGPVKTP
jgi:hypothetical protein